MRIPRATDRLRPRSVRAKIVALLMLPVVSLMALWGFAAVTTASSIGDAERGKDVNAELLAPVGEFVTDVQGERTAALRGDPDGYRKAQTATDRAAAVVLEGINSAGSDAGLLDAALPARLDALKGDTGALTALRTRPTFDGYSAIVRHGFAVTGALAGAVHSADASDARVLLELGRAREAVAQEQALLADGQLTRAEYAPFVGAVANQRELLEPAVADLKAEHRAAYRRVLDGDRYATVRAVEDQVRKTGAVPSLTGWDLAVGQVLGGLAGAEADAGVAATAKANPFGWDTLGASGVAVVLGLVGVLLSLLVSVLVGRGLIVELLDLRNSALEVAGRRLPQAMRRLHAGQGVDIDAEAPMRRLVGDELAQVGTALTAVQRAALKAASERAELLSGISGVYVSLARRSQVLLHRQLDLLSALEHREQHPADLHDLYRVDYLATRMRRHSESLLILSGIAPGRGWRDPIALTDVLRAAVSEIENADRVQIWATPRVSLVGGCVADVVHLLAELVENATSFSPPSTQVHLRAAHLREGILIEIEDSGFGMNEDALTDANRKIQSDKVDLLDAKQIGLFVVNRLRERQGLRVELRASETGGVIAGIFIPEHLVRDDMPTGDQGRGLAPAAGLLG
ncbi:MULTISPECIES: nitrate- and nitrite sensing domain-containing protein [unclassified Streptomyces]|uniref:sensor histidine kinase n=1 Tax=unclassified Streptomyces TaxID=2593676 RepID=UPI000DD8E925|nr:MULTISPECIES: nitrate- and nitrite sensing domain-containing protein [unclassified Streptomyces]QZZ28324.1 sensor histidine kinase [Streptomyces sp. ST1015]